MLEFDFKIRLNVRQESSGGPGIRALEWLQFEKSRFDNEKNCSLLLIERDPV